MPTVALVAAMTAALATAAPDPAGRGVVDHVAAGRAFLSRGSADGLTAGTKVDLLRGRARIGACTIEEVAPHHATCVSQAARPRDTVSYSGTAKPAPSSKTLTPLATPEQTAAARAAIAAVSFAKISATTTPKLQIADGLFRARASLRSQSFVTFGADDAAYTRAVLDISVQARPLSNLVLNGDARLVGDIVQPDRTRFRKNDFVELYLWDLSARSADDEDSLLTYAVGRFRPRHAPGVTLLDGAQGGLRFGGVGARLEVGAYVGGTPDLINLLPTTVPRATAGAYFSASLASGRDVFFGSDSRVALVVSPDLQLRGELESQMTLMWNRVIDAAVSARVSAGQGGAPFSFDALRASVGLEPLGGFTTSLSYRFLGPQQLDYDALVVSQTILPVLSTHHVDGDARYQVASWLVLGVLGGFATDAGFTQPRTYVGPEVTFPGTFGPGSRLRIGYLEELGFMPGRSAFTEQIVTPLPDVWLASRLSYYETEAIGDPQREIAATVHIDWHVLSWLAFDGRVAVQGALPGLDTVARETPAVLLLDVGATGTF